MVMHEVVGEAVLGHSVVRQSGRSWAVEGGGIMAISTAADRGSRWDGMVLSVSLCRRFE